MKKLILIALIFASCIKIKQEEKCRYLNEKGLYELNETCIDGYNTTSVSIISTGKSIIPISRTIWHCTKKRIDTIYVRLNNSKK